MTRWAALPLLLALVACKRSPDPEAMVRYEYVKKLAYAEDAGNAFRLTSTEEVFFDVGWYPMEMAARNVHGLCFRWQGHTSLTRLRAHDHAMRLTLVGWAPYEFIGQAPPSMTIRINGVRALGFLAPAGPFTKELVVTPEQQAGRDYVDLLIETSTVGWNPGDSRDLGYGLNELHWEPAQ